MAEPLYGANASQIKRNRRIAEMLMSNSFDASPTNPYGAIARIAQGFVGGMKDKEADKLQEQQNQTIAQMLGAEGTTPDQLEAAGVQYENPMLVGMAGNRRQAANQAADDQWRQQRAATQDQQWQQSFGADEAWRQAQLANQQNSGITNDIQARTQGASQLGLMPDNPAYQAYVLTGKMPREDMQKLTPTDKKAIFEADEMAMAGGNTISQLDEAMSLNEKAGSGMLAGPQAWAARNDPTGFFDDTQGQNTTNFQNLVLNQALGSLKSTFGAAPTEGERQILLELQASVDKTPQERAPILERAKRLAMNRMKFNQDRASELRSGTFYQPDGTGQQQQGMTVQPQVPGNNTYDTNMQAIMQQAQDAIAAGADPEQVKARLRDMGIQQ